MARAPVMAASASLVCSLRCFPAEWIRSIVIRSHNGPESLGRLCASSQAGLFPLPIANPVLASNQYSSPGVVAERAGVPVSRRVQAPLQISGYVQHNGNSCDFNGL